MADQIAQPRKRQMRLDAEPFLGLLAERSFHLVKFVEKAPPLPPESRA